MLHILQMSFVQALFILVLAILLFSDDLRVALLIRRKPPRINFGLIRRLYKIAAVKQKTLHEIVNEAIKSYEKENSHLLTHAANNSRHNSTAKKSEV